MDKAAADLILERQHNTDVKRLLLDQIEALTITNAQLLAACKALVSQGATGKQNCKAWDLAAAAIKAAEGQQDETPSQ